MGFEKLKERWRDEDLERQQQAAARKAALTRAEPVFESFGVQRAVLFGSAAAGKSAARSDIDLLVWSLSAADYWPFKRAVEEATGYSCDLHTQDDDPIFVKKVLERGEVVYERA